MHLRMSWSQTILQCELLLGSIEQKTAKPPRGLLLLRFDPISFQENKGMITDDIYVGIEWKQALGLALLYLVLGCQDQVLVGRANFIRSWPFDEHILFQVGSATATKGIDGILEFLEVLHEPWIIDVLYR